MTNILELPYYGHLPNYTINADYSVSEVDKSIGELVVNKKFKGYVSKIESEVKANPSKFIKLSQKYLK